MFCIECGQELPTNAKFCCRCGAAVNNISNPTTPPIMDDVAAKAEDVVITDEIPSLDAQNVNDDVLRKASFIGYPDNYIPTTNNYTPINTPSPKSITDHYPKVSKTTFFGGQLTLVKTEHSKDDYSYELQGVNFISDKYSHVYQTSVDDCIFIAHTVGDKQKILLRWDYRQRLMVQDISESFTHIKAPFANYFKVERNGNIGYVCFDTESKRLKYVIDCKYPSISVDNYSDNQLIVFGVNNYFLVCSADSPKEEYNTFIKITDNIFKAQKRGEQSYALLQWDKTQKRLIYALSSHNFDYISNDINLSYIKVKENGKYGYVKVNDNGYCDLKIPCIFDNTSKWVPSVPKLFLDDVSPTIVTPVKYNGKDYLIDPHMQFYVTSRISRLGRAVSDITGWMKISTTLIIIAIILWLLFSKGYLGYYIDEALGILGALVACIFCFSILGIIIRYNSHYNPIYVKLDMQDGKIRIPQNEDYNKLKKYAYPYIFILFVSFGIFMYEVYVFNWKYDRDGWSLYSYENKGIVFPVKKNKEWGYIDFVGREIIPLQFTYASTFSRITKMARVCIGGAESSSFGDPYIEGGKWGYIDIDGNPIIPLEYDYVGDFEEGIALVNVGGINTVSDYGYLKHNNGGKWGCINISGEEIIPIEYDEIHLIRASNLIFVNVRGKWGVFNKDGREITPAIWDYTTSFNASTETYVLRNGNMSIRINKKGERVK